MTPETIFRSSAVLDVGAGSARSSLRSSISKPATGEAYAHMPLGDNLPGSAPSRRAVYGLLPGGAPAACGRPAEVGAPAVDTPTPGTEGGRR